MSDTDTPPSGNLAALHPTLARDALDFFRLVAQNEGEQSAALAVGWSPDKLRRMKREPEFAQILSDVRTRRIESVEKRLFERAEEGSLTAIQMILYCLAPERGWRPPTQRVNVQQATKVEVEIVEATKAVVVDLLESHGVEALQAGGPLDEIEEAEVVE